MLLSSFIRLQHRAFAIPFCQSSWPVNYHGNNYQPEPSRQSTPSWPDSMTWPANIGTQPPPPHHKQTRMQRTGPWNTDAQPRWQIGQNAKHHTLQISTENLPGSFLQNLTKLVISGTMADMNCRHMESASSFSLLRSGCTQTEQSTTDPLVHVPQYHNTMTQTEQLTTDPLVFVPQHYDTDRTANSKRWFTTSFLQPLPYLVTPLDPENCQLTSRFLLVLKQ